VKGDRVIRSAWVLTLVLSIAGTASAKPPSWDRRIDSPKRFKVLTAFDGEAVLDQETGLVWERAPIASSQTWAPAVQFCIGRIPGDRLGWRLPRIEELLSLIDPVGIALPAGSPFDLGGETAFWTATTVATNTGPDLAQAFIVTVGSGFGPAPKTNGAIAWCVRGGESVDGQ
jgi:hypothetical protein